MSYYPGDENPRNLRAEYILRLANASWVGNSDSNGSMRFVMLGFDEYVRDFTVADVLTDRVLTVSELISWLPEDLRQRVLYN